jgi:1-acyl-sn-glycerol-3-phosphate acyltransferase
MRVTTGEIGHFNKGAFHLATELGAPIAPFFICIPREIDPGMGYGARPGTVDVCFKPLIDTSCWRVEEVLANTAYVRDLFVQWHRDAWRRPAPTTAPSNPRVAHARA